MGSIDALMTYSHLWSGIPDSEGDMHGGHDGTRRGKVAGLVVEENVRSQNTENFSFFDSSQKERIVGHDAPAFRCVERPLVRWGPPGCHNRNPESVFVFRLGFPPRLFDPKAFGFTEGTFSIKFHNCDDSDWVRAQQSLLQQDITWTILYSIPEPESVFLTFFALRALSALSARRRTGGDAMAVRLR